MKAEPDFGVKIPAQPQLMLDMEQARGLLHRQDASLVSIRSWPEFIGTTSGYSYIKPKGEIAGARWGHAGSDSTHMKIFITRMAPCAAPMHDRYVESVEYQTRAASFNPTAAPAGARPKPLCTHAPWVGRMFPCMTAAGTNGAAIQKIR